MPLYHNPDLKRTAVPVPQCQTFFIQMPIVHSNETIGHEEVGVLSSVVCSHGGSLNYSSVGPRPDPNIMGVRC